MRQKKRHFKIFQTKMEARAWEVEIKKTPLKEKVWKEEVKEEAISPPPPEAPKEPATPSASLDLIDWASKYLQYAKTRFVSKTFGEKRSTFKRFFTTVEPHLAVKGLRPVAVLD